MRHGGGEDVATEPWQVLWSTGAQSDPHFQMNPSGHTGGVDAVVTTFSDGRHVVVTDSKDQTVRVRDLETGQPVGGPMSDLNGRVWAVATEVVGGRPCVVTASDWAVLVWDLATRQQTGELPGINGEWCWARLSSRGGRVRSPATTTCPCGSGIWPVGNRSANSPDTTTS